MRSKLLVALCLLLSIPAFAQQVSEEEEKKMMEAYLRATTPGDAHKALQPLVGTWDTVIRFWQAPGAPVQVAEGYLRGGSLLRLGRAVVRQTFKVGKVGTIAGCYVTEGVIDRKSRVRVVRDGVQVYEGELGSLKRFKDDAREVREGFECGLSVAGYNDLKIGDRLEISPRTVETHRERVMGKLRIRTVAGLPAQPAASSTPSPPNAPTERLPRTPRFPRRTTGGRAEGNPRCAAALPGARWPPDRDRRSCRPVERRRGQPTAL